MRHLGRNLVVHSDERAIMINSAGHIIFEQPLEGTGPVVAEFFQDVRGEIISCFVRGEKVTIYNGFLLRGVFTITSEVEDLTEGEMQEVFEPLHLLFDSITNSLYLIVTEGSSESQNLVSSYAIDFNAMEAKKLSSITINDFSDSKRTRSHLIFFRENAFGSSTSVTAFSQTLVEKAEWTVKGTAQRNMLSINDDIVFDKGNYMNLAEEKVEWKPTKNDFEPDCKLQRARESENTVLREREVGTIKLLAQC